jgi:hypothetical protein
MRPKVGLPLRPFSFVFDEVCKTFVSLSATAKAIVELSQEKATLRASGSVYWRERQKRALAQEETEKHRKQI